MGRIKKDLALQGSVSEGLTAEDLMLIQPNNVTFGQYAITDWQENLLTLINDKLQKHMSREENFPCDEFGQPCVEVECDEVGGRNHKSVVVREALDLTKKPFSFRWLHPRTGKDIKTMGVIITAIHDVIGTNIVKLTINPWAMPFLIYYGVGVGGTRYSKNLALSLRGNYTKRLYKIICSQRDRQEYYYPIEQFRKDLCVSESYSNAQISQKILRPAKERIRASGSDVWFDYKMICRHPTKDRKPKADTILLKIHTLNPTATDRQQYLQYSFVYRWVRNALGNPSNDKPLQVVEMIAKQDRLKQVYDRCVYYHNRVNNGEQDLQHAENSLRKMLREEFGVK